MTAKQEEPAHLELTDSLSEACVVRILQGTRAAGRGWHWRINGMTVATQAGPHPLELTLHKPDVAELAAAGRYALAEYAGLPEQDALAALDAAGFRPMQAPCLTPHAEAAAAPALRVYLALTPAMSARYAFLEDIETKLPLLQDGGLICRRTRWGEAASNAGHFPYARHLDWDCGEPGDGAPEDLALNALAQLLPPVPGEATEQTANGETVSARAWRLKAAFARDLLAPLPNAGGEVPIGRLRAWLAAHP